MCDEVNPKSLFFPTGPRHLHGPNSSHSFLLRQEKASKPIDNKSVQNYVSLLWKDVVPEVEVMPRPTKSASVSRWF